MAFDPENNHRKSIRLQGYDYSRAGAYYFTLCTQNKVCLFGEVVDGEMVLKDAGQMVEKWYVEIENKYPDIRCGLYTIMPNHMHAIIHNVGATLRVCFQDNQENGEIKGEHTGSPLHLHSTFQHYIYLFLSPVKNSPH